jgi:hypothetical protein
MKEIQFTIFNYVLGIILFYFGSGSGMMNTVDQKRSGGKLISDLSSP